MKRLALLLCLFLLVPLAGCAERVPEDDGRISVVASSFPAYDFARGVAGGAASVTMLIPPGTEVHSYDPTPQDIRRIRQCDLFIYCGGESDAWMEDILASLDRSHTAVLAMMDAVPLLGEETAEGMEAEEGEGDGEYDEHVWTSPANAARITAAIRDALCAADPENASLYRANAESYIGQLEELSEDFAALVASAARKTVVFADRFPLLYFVREFGLEYYAAFPGCAEETEPGAQTLAFLIRKVREEEIPYVFTIEFSSGRVADMICEAAGCGTLPFHSCHNVTRDEWEAGETYVSLMRRNLENLRLALG